MNSEMGWQGMLFVSSPIFLYATYCVLKLVSWKAVGWTVLGLAAAAFLIVGFYGMADMLNTAHGTMILILCLLVGHIIAS